MTEHSGTHIERGLVRTHTGYVHYRAAGQGPAIMLAHINQQSSALMLELMQALAPRMRAIAIDYPSHGHSDPIAWQPSIGTYAHCIVEVMDALKIDRATALGEAVGASVATELGAGHAERIDRVVLVNCPYYPNKSIADQNHAPLKTGLRPADSSGFPTTRTLEFVREQDPGHAPVNPSQSWMDRVNTAQIEVGRNRWQALDALHDYPLNQNLARLNQPVLLLIGEHFHYCKFRGDFDRLIPKVSSHVLAGGRFCMTWERAEEIARFVHEFVYNGGADGAQKSK
jgi:pimeloyl-ACP methyl ester carboxylesterase